MKRPSLFQATCQDIQKMALYFLKCWKCYYISEGTSEKQKQQGRLHIHIYTFVYIYIYIYNWLMQLWRLRSPQICKLQAGDPEKLTCSCHPKASRLKTQKNQCFSLRQKTRRDQHRSSTVKPSCLAFIF